MSADRITPCDLPAWTSWATGSYSTHTIRQTTVAAASLIRLTGVPVESATAADLDRWWQLIPMDPATRGAYLSGLCRFYRWRLLRDPAASDPTRYLTRPRLPRRLPRPVSAAAVEVAVAATAQPCRTWIAVAAWAGLRRAEIAGLSPGHVHVDGTTLSLRITGKGGRQRLIPVPPRLATVLAGYGWPIRTAGHVGDQVATCLRRLGIDATCHQLRHYYATELYRATGDVLAVSTLMGHASVATTQVYAQVDDQHLAALVMETFGT